MKLSNLIAGCVITVVLGSVQITVIAFQSPSAGIKALNQPFSSPGQYWPQKATQVRHYTKVDEDAETIANARLEKEEVPVNYGIDRRMFVTALAATMLAATQSDAANAEETTTTTKSSVPLPWESSPVNKRSGVTVFDAEKAGYNVAFVTYLSRFLLNFDPECQKYWYSSSCTKEIPRTASADQVDQIRLDQFAAFAASVEVGLIAYEGPEGPSQLLKDLVRRYGALPSKKDAAESDSVASQRRIAKAARRQIALLFALLEKVQPTSDITQLLASVDNGRVTTSCIKLVDNNKKVLEGFEVGKEPTVEFNPPQAGQGYEVAQGKAVFKPTGALLRVDIEAGGSGYDSKNPPEVSVSSPSTEGGTPVKLQAKIANGSMDGIRVLDLGSGYTDQDMEFMRITVAPPPAGGEAAQVKPIWNMALDRIEVTKEGSGYAVEKPLKVFLTPNTDTVTAKKADPQLVALAYPVAEKTSFSSFRRDTDSKRLQEQEDTFERKYNVKPSSGISGIESSSPPVPFWSGRSSSSSELLQLLPAGVGLEYDTANKRYALAMDTNFMSKYPAILQQKGSSRIIGTEFGPRGRAPIERDMTLGTSAYLRFWLSGASCASLVHGVLTPIEVAKTKLQTAPDKYPSIGIVFQKTAKEDGLPTFFAGWLPTILGNFFAGGALYVTTEFIRRSLSEAAGVDAVALEVPIILAAAAVASSLGSILICPFEAVRIRTVAQPDFAPNSVGVVKKMLEEEGIGSFIDAIPIFLVKNIPYAMTKFLIFDLSTEQLYRSYPAAQEDIKLSLLVSLVGGILGGSAAAFVSNPADAVISELKKSKSDISPQEAVAIMLERNGISTFFVGLPLRILFYSLIASLTFSVYDFVRFLLRVGPDDLKLYLDVLGGSLGNPPP